MIIYYSGSAGAITGRRLVAEPEVVLGDQANIMLSYGLILRKQQDQNLRLPLILAARRDQKVPVVNREDILQKLEAVQPGLTLREIIEQSSCFVFNKGEVLTYNEQVACRMAIDLKLEGAVQAAPLLELLRKMKEDEIDIIQDDGKLIVRGNKREGEFIMQSEILLPIDKIERPKKWLPLHEDFCEAVNLTSEISGKNGQDFRLLALNITPKCIESTDGFQLMRYRMKTGTGVETPCLVRKDSIKQIVPLGIGEVSESEAWLHFRNSLGLTISCRRDYSDDFPKIDQFMKLTGEETTLPKGLGDAAQRAEIFTREKKDENLVTVTLKPGKLLITGEGSYGRYKESKKISYQGQEMEFMIGPAFLVTLSEKHNECEICVDGYGNKFLKVNGGKYTYCTALGISKDETSDPAARSEDGDE